MRAHVLLGVGLEHAGEPETEAAEPPADDRAAPPLTAVEVRKTPVQLTGDARPVVVRAETVTRPEAHRLGPGGSHARDDSIERLAPADPAPGVDAPPVAGERMEQASGIVDDLPRRLAADAEEAPAVGIIGIAGHAEQAAVLDVHEHAAQGGMAVHRAHRANAAAVSHGRQDRPRAGREREVSVQRAPRRAIRSFEERLAPLRLRPALRSAGAARTVAL